MKLAVTADLHFGTRHTAGNEATLALAEALHADVPDVFILAGDIGAGDDFSRCLDLFADLPCRKACVPGNHDVWVKPFHDPRGDSQRLYEEWLPNEAAQRGFHYLDHGPMLLPEFDTGIVGNMNWYDYSWAIDALRVVAPDADERLSTKRFSRGMHNDANYVRWPWSDAEFTVKCVTAMREHIDMALRQVSKAIVVTHHPMFRALNYVPPDPTSLDSLLWTCFSGNAAMEELLTSYANRISHAFCGHTHSARSANVSRIDAVNIGGHYNFKRLVRYETSSSTEYEFTGSPGSNS